MNKFIVFDCEAAPMVRHTDGQAHPETALCYDVGYIVADNSGAIHAARSFVVSDTFANSDLMRSAYYARKLPQYRDGATLHTNDAHEWRIASWRDIRDCVFADCEEYRIRKVWAYNCAYDKEATEHTTRHYSNGFSQSLFSDSVEWRDIWKLAGNTVCNSRKYVQWCFDNGYYSAKRTPKTGAEIVARYLYRDAFIERHTALDDAACELDILLACKRYKKAEPDAMGNGWIQPNRIAKAMGLK